MYKIVSFLFKLLIHPAFGQKNKIILGFFKLKKKISCLVYLPNPPLMFYAFYADSFTLLFDNIATTPSYSISTALICNSASLPLASDCFIR